MALVSIRYARAFANVLLEHGLDATRAMSDVNQVVEVVRSNDALYKIWENPSVPAEQKRNLLDAISQRAGWSKEVHNLVGVIIDHRRVALLPEIARQLQTELNRQLGITEAEVTAARELSAAEQRELEEHIVRTSGGKSVRAHYRTDPSILGGVVVRIGSTIYDGSVKGQLRKIRESLSSA